MLIKMGIKLRNRFVYNAGAKIGWNVRRCAMGCILFNLKLMMRKLRECCYFVYECATGIYSIRLHNVLLKLPIFSLAVRPFEIYLFIDVI